MDDPVRLILGDCLEVMPTLDADSVDAVVTDPPYGLGFMGKHWDHGVPAVEFWQAMLRVARPGAYLLSFGGTRTVHRIACNIEDAGWTIRDELVWIYASGFPKGKANLKPAHEPIVLARKPGPLRPLGIDECRIEADPSERQAGWASSVGSGQKFPGSVYNPATTVSVPADRDPAGRWPSNVLLSDPDLFDQPNPYVVGSGATTQSTPFEWAQDRINNGDGNTFTMPFDKVAMEGGYGDSGGYSRFFIIPKADRAERERGLAQAEKSTNGVGALRDGGRQSESRANVHPTVKPIDLMRHLVRLVTPPGGVVLDPFLGSGTTALAASELGYRCIGIEREAEYLDIARGRLIATPIGLAL